MLTDTSAARPLINTIKQKHATVPSTSSTSSSSSESEAPLNYFEEFSRDLGIQPECDKKSGFFPEVYRSIKNDLAEATVCNSARKKVSELFHDAENGHADIKKNYKNNLFKSFQQVAEGSLSPLSQGGTLKNLGTHLQEYSNFLFEKNKGKKIHSKTTELFNNLLNLIPEEDSRKKAKELLSIMMDFGSNIINDIENDSREESRDTYLEACEQFVNLIFNPDNQQNPSDSENLDIIKMLIFNSLSCAGLLLIYRPRIVREHVCVWAKRLFAPIGFAMHELTGVGLELFLNPYIFAALAAGGAWTLSLMTTFAAGFAVVSFCEFLLDTALEVADKNVKVHSHAHILELKKQFDIAISSEESAKNQEELQKLKHGFAVRWCQKIFEKIKKMLSKIPNSLKEKKERKLAKDNAVLYMNTKSKTPQEVNQLIKEKNYAVLQNEKDLPVWMQEAKDKQQAVEYFNNLKNLEIDNNLFNNLFYLKHQIVNCKNSLSEKEIDDIKEKLDKLYLEITETITRKENINNTHVTNYLKNLIEKNSEILVSNSRSAANKAAHHSKFAVFTLFDFISDTFGVFLTKIIESTDFLQIVKTTVETFGSILGALVPVSLGILVYLFNKAVAHTWDEKTIQIPNENVEEYILAYLNQQIEQLREEERKLQQETGIKFARAAKLQAGLKKFEEFTTKIKEAQATHQREQQRRRQQEEANRQKEIQEYVSEDIGYAAWQLAYCR